MHDYLFSYGTLRESRVQLAIFGRLLAGENDVLVGFKTAGKTIEDGAFLARGEQPQQLTAINTNDPNDAITGTVFELSKEELEVADKYEPKGYQRIEVTLASGKTAWIYLAAKRVNIY